MGANDPGGKPSLATREYRATSKIGKDELLGLLDAANAPTATASDDPRRARQTQRVRAKHFQMLLRDGETDTLPLSPDGIDEQASEDELDIEQRAQRLAGLPRARTLEMPSDLLEQLTATEVRPERAPAKHAHTVRRARRTEPPSDVVAQSHASRVDVPVELQGTESVPEEPAMSEPTHDAVTRPVPQLEIVDEPPRPAAQTQEVTPEMLEEVAAVRTSRAAPPTMVLGEPPVERTAPRPASHTQEVTPEMLEEVAAVRRGPPTVELGSDFAALVKRAPSGAAEPVKPVEPARPPPPPTATSVLDAIIRKGTHHGDEPAPDAASDARTATTPTTESEPIELRPKRAASEPPAESRVTDLPFPAVRIDRWRETEEEPREAEPAPPRSGGAMLGIVAFLIVLAVVGAAVFAVL